MKIYLLINKIVTHSIVHGDHQAQYTDVDAECFCPLIVFPSSHGISGVGRLRGYVEGFTVLR